MIACLISKLRVYVNNIVVEQAKEQAVAQQNVVEILRVAFEDIRVSLALRQRFNQVLQDATLQRGKRGGEGEIVQVA